MRKLAMNISNLFFRQSSFRSLINPYFHVESYASSSSKTMNDKG